MPKTSDMTDFVATLAKPKKSASAEPAVKVEFPEPVLRWRFTITRDANGDMKEIIAEALE